MPFDIKQLRPNLSDMGNKTPDWQGFLFERQRNAQIILEEYSSKLEYINTLIIKIKSRTKSLRCALPFIDDLKLRYIPQTINNEINETIILAADGSQVNPDRHSPVEFGIINVGIYKIKPGSRQVPREYVHSQLLYHEDLYTSNGPIGEEIVALRRDLSERTYLAELVKQEIPYQVIALTDGPLELFREPADRGDYQEYLDEYLYRLNELSQLNSIVAGYVDRPRSDLVVRLLELMTLKDDELNMAGKLRPFMGVTDYDLFIELLKPGERSAIFGIESSSSSKFKDQLALHFFYLNVSNTHNPYIARVEIPRWVANDKDMLDSLQQALLQQCKQIGDRPYPYALHRAHEIALVSFNEKRQIEQMIMKEMISHGQGMGQVSNKQFAKDISGKRMRYR